MLIQKQLNGRVFAIENGNVLADLDKDCTMNLSTKVAGVVITDEVGMKLDLPLYKVQETQILPAAAVAFTGTVTDLWALLTSSFFNELHSNSGGGIVENNIKGQSGNYSVLTTDYIIYALAASNFKLPTIGANLGQTYRIFANGFKVTISCDDPAGDRILGETTQKISGFDMVTCRAISTNNWLIAD